jgi:hypothetical protein
LSKDEKKKKEKTREIPSEFAKYGRCPQPKMDLTRKNRSEYLTTRHNIIALC